MGMSNKIRHHPTPFLSTLHGIFAVVSILTGHTSLHVMVGLILPLHNVSSCKNPNNVQQSQKGNANLIRKYIQQ